jgi:hypothetical protein
MTSLRPWHAATLALASVLGVGSVAGFASLADAGSAARVRTQAAGHRPAPGNVAAPSMPALAHPVPLPPSLPGCYRYTPSAGWKAVPCTDSLQLSALPHPELLPGPFEKPPVAVPFVATTLRVLLSGVTAEIDTRWGNDAYSLQDDVEFSGTNGSLDAVQFTDQSVPTGVARPWAGEQHDNELCIWQVAGLAHPAHADYTPACVGFTGPYLSTIQGFTEHLQTVELVAPFDGGVMAVSAADLYGLEEGARFDNASGSILGEGGGSTALLGGSSAMANTTIDATTCLGRDGFFASGGSTPGCSGADAITKDAGAGRGAAISTSLLPSAESNNLVRVDASAPSRVWYPDDWNAEVSYTASRTGRCTRGKPPLCGL